MADLDDMPHPTRISPAAARSVVDPDRLGERTPGHLVDDLHAAFGRAPARAGRTAPR